MDTPLDASGSRRRLLRLLPVPLAVAALVGGATALVTSNRPGGYQARAAVHLNQQTAADPVRRVTRIVPSEVLDAVTSPELRRQVAIRLGRPVADSDVTISTRPGSNGDVLDITAKAATVGDADRLASSYASIAASRLETESQSRLQAATTLLSNEQATLVANQRTLAASVAALPVTDPRAAAANEQLTTMSRQATQLAAERDNILTTAALLGPAARSSATLDVTRQHPVSAKLTRGLLAGLGAGLLTALVALALTSVRRRVPALRVGERWGDVPVLAVVPRRASAADDPTPVEREAIDRIVGDILLEQRSRGCSVLAVAGPSRHCATSTTAAALAAGLARRGLKVLLVDADVRNPAQHTLHGTSLWPGLADTLRGEHLLSVRSREGVDVLPAGFTSAPADLLGHQSLVTMLLAARTRYDSVLIDVGSLEHPDAHLVAALTDRVLLCITPGRTTQTELIECSRSLRSGTLLGLVQVRLGRSPQPVALAPTLVTSSVSNIETIEAVAPAAAAPPQAEEPTDPASATDPVSSSQPSPELSPTPPPLPASDLDWSNPLRSTQGAR